MFVEIARLLIVLLSTGVGYAAGRHFGADDSAAVVLGAALGACAGYVLGGILARLLRKAMGTVERKVDRTPPAQLLVDSSAAIDGRLRAVTTAGFLRGALLVPRFVLDELQGIADAAEPARRRRGRRGLEILDSLQGDPRVSLHVVDDEVPEFDEVDAKLVALARRLDVGLLTTDFNLRRVAELQAVTR